MVDSGAKGRAQELHVPARARPARDDGMSCPAGVRGLVGAAQTADAFLRSSPSCATMPPMIGLPAAALMALPRHAMRT